MYNVLHYLDRNGTDHFQVWLDSIQDRQAQIAVVRRVGRLEAGLVGDHKSLRDGIHELKVDVGKGYRVYFAFVGRAIILLTCGGHKQTQDRDISLAIEMLRDWKRRNGQDTPPAR